VIRGLRSVVQSVSDNYEDVVPIKNYSIKNCLPVMQNVQGIYHWILLAIKTHRLGVLSKSLAFFES
jgi:hypothetical protein